MTKWFGFKRVVCVGLTLSLFNLFGCSDRSKHEKDSAAFKPLTDPATIAQVENFCGACHPNPSPSSFPRHLWPHEVEQGFQFYRDSDRHDLDEPMLKDVLSYFQSQAPVEVELPSAEQIKNYPTKVKFESSAVVLSGDSTSLTSHVFWDQQSREVFFADMTTGKFRRWAPDSSPGFRKLRANEQLVLGNETVLAEGKNSCRTHPVDWNQDGLTDYVLGELGSPNISDLRQGNISLLIQSNDRTFRRIVIKEELARSFEGVPFDYDEDGDIDILVAEFGRHKAGAFSILRNKGAVADDPRPEQFEYEVLDPRHGLLGIKIADMNGDGKNDLVTAFGQEFETVEILLNRGKGSFEKSEIIRFPDPSYNSSSIRVVDVDADGKLDILHTSGDIFDSFVPKRFHGVRLLRQREFKEWEVVELGMLIGAMDCAIADFDGDGDLDIASVGLFPDESATKRSYDSVVWFEQTSGTKFLRHSIERDHCYHASCDAADVDNDGRVDLIVGLWKEGEVAGSVRVFWNTLTN